MKLTTFTDYNLRVLMYLALEPDRLGTIDGVANAYGISANHLMKVVHHLARTGVVESVRGKGGGIRLARPASEIRLGAVIREAEGDGPAVECFGNHNQCRIAPDCRLAGVLARAFSGLYAYLDHYTLADLVERREGLVQMLQISR